MHAGVIQSTVMLLMRPWIGSCHWAMARLSGHLDHELPAREEKRIHRHLLRCRRCRAMYESLLRTVEHVRFLGRQGLDEPAPSVADLVVNRIRRERE